MQTKHQIRQLLDSAGLQPNKRLGQNFLIDLNLIRLLVESADIHKEDVVLEVGCGTGSLTESLTEKAGHVISVEYDYSLYNIANQQLSKATNLDLLNIDILKNKNTLNNRVLDLLTLARKSLTGRLLLVANLPYNVASPVMMNLITGRMKVDSMFVTVQKEVADRMKAGPGSSEYGVLSIIMSAAGDVEIIRILKPSVFWPRPQVDSAMVKFVHREDKNPELIDIKLFARIVHIFMNHRRKTIHAISRLDEAEIDGINNWDEIFTECNIDPTLRPDQISPEQYIAITTFIK